MLRAPNPAHCHRDANRPPFSFCTQAVVVRHRCQGYTSTNSMNHKVSTSLEVKNRIFLLTRLRVRPLTGFTLIELLVVIAIIGILASIVLASMGTARAKARDAKRIADIKNIQLALETYYTDNLKYPANIYTGGSSLSPNYMQTVPYDPSATTICSGTSNTDCYFYTAMNAQSSINCVNVLNPPIRYHLGARLEVTANDGVGAFAQDVDIAIGYNGTLTGLCSASMPAADFNGRTVGCTGSQVAVGAPENCYDVTN